MSSPDYEKVQVDDVEEDEEDNDSIEDYERDAVAAAGEEDEEDEEVKSDQGDEDKQQTRTLMRELLDQYEDMKKNGSQLPSRKAAIITSRTIGSTLMIIITTNTVYL